MHRQDRRSSIVSFGAGASIELTPDFGNGIAIVERGRVDGIAIDSTGRRVVIASKKPGEVLQDLVYSPIGAIAYSRVAVSSPTVLLLIDGEAIAEAACDDGALHFVLLVAASAARRQLLDRIRMLSFYKLRSRIARYLIETHVESKRLKIEDLAMEVGTVPEVASRLLREFKHKGTVLFERGKGGGSRSRGITARGNRLRSP